MGSFRGLSDSDFLRALDGFGCPFFWRVIECEAR